MMLLLNAVEDVKSMERPSSEARRQGRLKAHTTPALCNRCVQTARHSSCSQLFAMDMAVLNSRVSLQVTCQGQVGLTAGMPVPSHSSQSHLVQGQ